MEKIVNYFAIVFLQCPPYLLRHEPLFERKNACKIQEIGVGAGVRNSKSQGNSKFTTCSNFTTRSIFRIDMIQIKHTQICTPLRGKDQPYRKRHTQSYTRSLQMIALSTYSNMEENKTDKENTHTHIGARQTAYGFKKWVWSSLFEKNHFIAWGSLILKVLYSFF